ARRRSARLCGRPRLLPRRRVVLRQCRDSLDLRRPCKTNRLLPGSRLARGRSLSCTASRHWRRRLSSALRACKNVCAALPEELTFSRP
ncbi:hypothetical protein H4217_009061, partial [Coemansia sp. RSA 1939]